MEHVRPFNRADRDQLTELVNAHIAAVVPGWGVSVSALLSQLEREPAQYVVDPWVVERSTLVTVRDDRIVAAAYLKRYGTDARVMPDYHDAGEIAWLVCWPHAVDAGHALARSCTDQLDAWGVSRQWADGDLPTPATYGIPDAWPHIREVIAAAGFADDDAHTEALYAGPLDRISAPGPAPIDGLTVRREVSNLTTRFVAELAGEAIGWVHVRDDLTRGGTLLRLVKWAELWDNFVVPEHRKRGVSTWLLQNAVAWVRLGGAERMLVPVNAEPYDEGIRDFYIRFGWEEISRSRRGWRRL